MNFLKKQKAYLSAIALSGILVSFTGCTLKVQETSILQEPTVNTTTIDSTKSMDSLNAVAIQDTTPQFDCSQGDSLINKAVMLCIDSNYIDAHKYSDSALAFVEHLSENPELSCNNEERIIYRIAELYLSFFPPQYLDSIPQDIAGLIFKSQFAIYDDYSDSTDSSSSQKVSMICDNGTPYNINIERNDRVEHALYKVAVKRARSINNLLERASYYLPIMKKVFQDKGMPTDLAYLPLLESGFKPKAYSYAHASGIWQFIPSTGRIFGLRNGYWLDERRDPLKSTTAAANYLQKLFKDFNDWHLALAAYNCGERRVERAIKTAESKNYWDLKLPKQTMHYVPLYMAYQMVGKNPQCFGFSPEPTDSFDLDTVTVSDCLDMRKIAKAIEVNPSEFKKINPHIKHWCTPPDLQNVTLYLPKGKVEAYKSYYETLTDNDKVKWYRYRIRSGDNLGSISNKFRTNMSAIKSINNMRSNRIIAGRYLFIPIPADGMIPTEKKPKLQLVHSEPIEAVQFRKQGLQPTKYILKKGDTMSELAEIFKVSVADIKRWNNIRSPKKLRAGTTLKFYIKPDKSHPAYVKASQKEIGNFPDTTGLSRGTYRVRSGDNFYSISKSLGVNMNHLLVWNNKSGHKPIIHAGENLVYYRDTNKSQKYSNNSKSTQTNYTKYKVQSGDNLYNLSSLFGVELNRLMKINNLSLNSVIKSGDILRIPLKQTAMNNSSSSTVLYYKVRTGDNFWEISRQFGVSLQSIYQANGLTSRSILKPGDVIKINKPERS